WDSSRSNPDGTLRLCRTGRPARLRSGAVPLTTRPRNRTRACWHDEVEQSTAQQVMNHLSVDDRQHGVELPERLVGDPQLVEIVVAQHHDIPKLALLDRAELGLLLQEPAVFHGVEADRLFPRNLLTGIDQFSRNVLAGDHTVYHVPRIQRGDLCG